MKNVLEVQSLKFKKKMCAHKYTHQSSLKNKCP